MKRISPEQIAGICGKFQRSENKKEGLHLLADWGADAQLKSCEAELLKLKKEWARELFKELEDKILLYQEDEEGKSYILATGRHAALNYKALKSKLLGEE